MLLDLSTVAIFRLGWSNFRATSAYPTSQGRTDAHARHIRTDGQHPALRYRIAMSTTNSSISHLAQEPLSSNDQKILAGIEDWTCKAKFEKINVDNFELCVDVGLAGTLTLLKDMDLVQKVWQDVLKKGYRLYIFQFPIHRWSIIRIPGPHSAPFVSSEGNALICPIRVIQGKPTISGSPLTVRERTYIMKGVDISPSLDILFLLL